MDEQELAGILDVLRKCEFPHKGYLRFPLGCVLDTTPEGLLLGYANKDLFTDYALVLIAGCARISIMTDAWKRGSNARLTVADIQDIPFDVFRQALLVGSSGNGLEDFIDSIRPGTETMEMYTRRGLYQWYIEPKQVAEYRAHMGIVKEG
jgi:hypothetical protein